MAAIAISNRMLVAAEVLPESDAAAAAVPEAEPEDPVPPEPDSPPRAPPPATESVEDDPCRSSVPVELPGTSDEEPKLFSER